MTTATPKGLLQGSLYVRGAAPNNPTPVATINYIQTELRKLEQVIRQLNQRLAAVNL